MTTNILVTGGAGFIGSNFIPYFLAKNKNYKVINLDLLTYAANPDYLYQLHHNPNYVFVAGDICNRALVARLFKQYDIRGVINFAAESHVDNSIKNPERFLQTNIMGTFTLLDVAYKYWMTQPFSWRTGYSHSRFHHISTDEVFGSLTDTGFFSETTPYAPNSPYSASKASSDFIARSYYHTYGLNITTSNCSNNYGPQQHKEKLIPTIIEKALAGEPIPIYGNGKNIRDWLYVEDHCNAIDLIYHKGITGQTYNVGGGNEKTNLAVADAVLTIIDELRPRSDGKSYKSQLAFVTDRAGHDWRYAIDASKITTELCWQAQHDFSSGIKATVQWYLKSYAAI